jgi:NADPH:quinone reductase-like Zn-dependent oxidoreductase
VRVRNFAAAVSSPDITSRYGQSPFVPKLPFTPGYAFIGEIEELGEDVVDYQPGDIVGGLTAYGSYSEVVYWRARRLIPVPADIDYGEAVPIILNYIVAYHALHMFANVIAGQTVMINGASGGIGTALLQLGKLAGLKMYGTASKQKHAILEEYGAVPIDYQTQDFAEVVRSREPKGIDAVFDGMAGESFKKGFSILGRGGTLVGYGNPLSVAGMFQMLGQVALYSVIPNGKKVKYYSTGISNFKWQRFIDDWALLFRFLQEGKIKPVIEARFPLLEARQANELLESGNVVGNIVLTSHL